MFARFDENAANTLHDIKETKRHGRTHTRTDGQRENSIPPQTKFAGGIIMSLIKRIVISPVAGPRSSVLTRGGRP